MDDGLLFEDVFAISGGEDTPEAVESHVFAAEDMHICEEGSPEIILIDEEEEEEDHPCIPREGDEYREYDDNKSILTFAASDAGRTPPVLKPYTEESEDDTLLDESQQSGLHSIIDPPEERLELMQQLEELCLSVLEQLAKALDDDDGVVKAKKANRIVVELADRRRTSSNGSPATRTLMFPRKGRGASIQPLAQLFRVVSLVHEALATDIPMTKRDMYYKDVELFKSQCVVDRLVDDLAATLGVGRADLNVRASSKGLVCGSGLVIHLHGGDTVEVNDSEGTLIPAGPDIARFNIDDSLSWVLIVEKEAVFQTLCRVKFANHPDLPGPGLIITGKGYPDIATRQLVKTLSDNLPSYIPILSLVDGDAFGLDILSVYRFGSAQMQHESLAAARVRWLGICTSELAGLGISKDALIPITKHDEKKALSMLRRSGLPKKWRKELQYMLYNRRKAEIEILSSVQRKATASGFDCDPPGRHFITDPLDSLHLVPLQTSEPPCLITYLADKITAIVDSYAAK